MLFVLFLLFIAFSKDKDGEAHSVSCIPVLIPKDANFLYMYISVAKNFYFCGSLTIEDI